MSGINILISIIAIEVFLLIVVLLATVFFRFYIKKQAKRKKQILHDLIQEISRAAEDRTIPSFSKFSKNDIDLACILLVMKELEISWAHPHWHEVHIWLIQEQILPLARKYALSSAWEDRVYALRGFQYALRAEDELLIVNLINDPIPLVSLHAAETAVKLGTSAAVNAFITRLSKKRWITKSPYLQALDHANNKMHRFVLKRLRNTKIINIKTACYNILLRLEPVEINWDIMADINQQQDLDLRLAAVKLLGHSREPVIPVLTNLLKDRSVEVRLVSLHVLSKLNARESINEIAACLNDAAWWVKLSAAEVLANFGEEGKQAVKMYNEQFVEVSPLLTKHIANTWW